MKDINYFQPTEICYGCGRINEVGEIVARFGKRCVLVTVPEFDAFAPLFAKVKKSLEDAGVAVAHFDGVIPNPTTESIAAGAEVALAHRADVMLGLGGGSSMDSAKAIAVEATHEGGCWDYRYCSDTQPTEKTLPVVAVTTTSGTGSQVTQVAVMTNTANRDKSAIYNSICFPKVAIVDPELMLTLPEHVTASTGFDVFCHCFESYLHPNASPLTDMMSLEAMRLVVAHLPTVVKDGSNIEGRSAMAWADMLAGLAIANAGVTLPHGVGMAISGMHPHAMHGEALAANYPAFTRYTYQSAVDKFATAGRILDPALEGETDEAAAEKSCELIDAFLKEIGMWMSLEDLKVPENEVADLAKQSMVLPDYENNPRVATFDEMNALLQDCYRR